MDNSDYWQQVEELFHAALAQPPEARAQFLLVACGNHETLRAEVTALLAAHETAQPLPLASAIQAVAEQFLHAADPPSLIGNHIRQYHVRSKLGHGGMGEVYLAYDQQLCRQVALKRLLVPPGAHAQAKRRFRREAQAAAQLEHPNVCAIHEVLEENAECFIVMQYIAGETLAARLQRAPLTVDEALDYAVQIAAALHAAQQAGVIHRDLKPHNIMLDAHGQVKVLDFGIAKLAGPAETRVAAPTLTTNPALVLGTPNYMSPEQARGETVDARSDLFCLGIVLYEMLTGQPPFTAPSASEVLANVLKTDPAPLQTQLPGVSAELKRVLRKALAKPVEQRYQTAQALLDDLQQIRRARREPPSTTATWRNLFAWRISNVGWRGWAAVVLLVLLLAIGWRNWQRPAPTQPRDPSGVFDSIAVLPFSRAADADAYLADGLAEELINDLARLPDLRVTPRSVVFGAQAHPFDLRQAHERLQVKALLTGRVIVRDGRVELQVELIETARQAQVWGRRFSRPVAELQMLRQEVTSALLAQLRPARSVAPGPKQHQTSAAAYAEYLKGRYALRQRLRGEAGSRSPRTVNLLEGTLKLDPHFAPAWAALAAAYTALLTDGVLPPQKGARQAKDAALKALSLDNSLPEAHLALADLYFYCDWNFAEAEREFKRFIELSPHDAQPWRSYAQFLTYQRRFAEAEQALHQARQLEPFSYANELARARLFNRTRQHDDAINHCHETIKLYPQQLGLKIELANAYLAKGQFKEALALREKINDARRTPSSLFRLALYHAAAGERAQAFQLLTRYQAERAASHTVSYRYAYGMARIHAVLGEKEQCLQYLEQAYQQRVVALVALGTDSVFDPLRDDPRFLALLRRIGLP